MSRAKYRVAILNNKWNMVNGIVNISDEIFSSIKNIATIDQVYNARKVNCSCVYSAYNLKPVLSGRKL